MLRKIGAGNVLTVLLVAILLPAGVLNWRYNKTESDAEKASYDALIEKLKVAQTAEDVAAVTAEIDKLLAGKQEK